jgi:hypothetical protein
VPGELPIPIFLRPVIAEYGSPVRRRRLPDLRSPAAASGRSCWHASGGGARVPGRDAGDASRCPNSRWLARRRELRARRTSRARWCCFDFWATWCGPCHLQADILKELYPGRGEARRRVRGDLDRRGCRHGARFRRPKALPLRGARRSGGGPGHRPRDPGPADAGRHGPAGKIAYRTPASPTPPRSRPPCALPARGARADAAWSSSPSSSSSFRPLRPLRPLSASAGRGCRPRARPRPSSGSPPPISSRCASSAGSVRGGSGDLQFGRLRSTLGRADFTNGTVELNPHLLDRNPAGARADPGPRALPPGGGSAGRPRAEVEEDDGGLRCAKPTVCHRLDTSHLARRRRIWIWRCKSCGQGYPPSSRRAALPLRRLRRPAPGHRPSREEAAAQAVRRPG